MILFRFCLLLFAFLQSANSFSQIVEQKWGKSKEINGLDTSFKLQALDSLSTVLEKQNSADYEEVARKTIEIALYLDSLNLAGHRVSRLILYLTNRQEQPEKGLELYEYFQPRMQDVEDSVIITELLLRGASSYFYSNQWEKSLQVYDEAKMMALSIKDSLRYGQALTYKAFAMSEMGEFVKASKEYQAAVKVFKTQQDTVNILSARVGLSILYGKNGFYEKSLTELMEVKEMAIQVENIPIYIIALANMSTIKYLLEQYAEALVFIEEAVILSENNPQFSSGITNTYKGLANCYSKLGMLDAALEVIQKMRMVKRYNPDASVEMNLLESEMVFAFEKGDFDTAVIKAEALLDLKEGSNKYESLLSTLAVISEAYGALGNESKELRYFKEYSQIKDSINTVHKLNAFSYYQALYETEKRDNRIAQQHHEIKLLHTKNELQFQWMLLGTVVLFLIGCYFYFLNKTNKAKAKSEAIQKALAQQHIKSAQLENDLLNRDLEYQNKDLINFAVEIANNQEWARVLLNKFKNIQSTSGDEKQKEIELMGREIKEKLAIDLESKGFYEKAEQIGSLFYNELNSICPALSKNEIRLCVLIRMKFTPKQIASLQNISHNSVITSRYRLKKKLQLRSEENLDDFVANI